MIRYDANTKTMHMTLVDLEHCGFDYELYRSELFLAGMSDEDESLLWPDKLIVEFAGGAVVTVEGCE